MILNQLLSVYGFLVDREEDTCSVAPAQWKVNVNSHIYICIDLHLQTARVRETVTLRTAENVNERRQTCCNRPIGISK